MAKIISKEELAKDIGLIKIDAEDIAKKAKAGQFVVLMTHEYGERIPLTIADHDDKTIDIVFMVVGATTKRLCSMKEGDSLYSLVGPLGKATELEKVGKVVVVGGGCGAAPAYTQAKAWKEEGNEVVLISGFRNKDAIFWEDKMEDACDELVITTDDGSYGKKGIVTDALAEIKDADLVVTVGPVIMMKAVADFTRGKIKTIVSLNPIMVDGVGMCGSCRVTVGGEVKFACADGPDFDGHLVDFDELMNRNKSYIEIEGHGKGGVCYGKDQEPNI